MLSRVMEFDGMRATRQMTGLRRNVDVENVLVLGCLDYSIGAIDVRAYILEPTCPYALGSSGFNP